MHRQTHTLNELNYILTDFTFVDDDCIACYNVTKHTKIQRFAEITAPIFVSIDQYIILAIYSHNKQPSIKTRLDLVSSFSF